MKYSRLLTVAFVLAVIAATLYAVGEAIQQIDIAIVDPFFQPAVSTVQAFFASTVTMTALAFVRNLFGAFRNHFKDADTQYEIQKLGETWSYYSGLGFAIALAIPAPYSAIGQFLIFLIDVFTSEWRHHQEKIKEPP